MAPDHQLSERVYHALKSDLLNRSLHELRLPITRLEARYHTSATPVREALMRLVGEGLVLLNPTGGFSLPRLTENQIRNLYELNMQIVLNAATWRQQASPAGQAEAVEPRCGNSIDELFLALADATQNLALVTLVESMNDKLRRIRRAEGSEMGNLEDELRNIERQVQQGDRTKLRRSLIAYHRRRMRHCREISAHLLNIDGIQRF